MAETGVFAVFAGMGGIASPIARSYFLSLMVYVHPETTPSGGGQLPARPPLRTVLESFPSYGLYSDNYFWGLATIINSRKSHLSFLTQPQLKLS